MKVSLEANLLIHHSYRNFLGISKCEKCNFFVVMKRSLQLLIASWWEEKTALVWFLWHLWTQLQQINDFKKCLESKESHAGCVSFYSETTEGKSAFTNWADSEKWLPDGEKFCIEGKEGMMEERRQRG